MKVVILSSPDKMKTAEKIKRLCSSMALDPLIYGDDRECKSGLFSCLDKNDFILIIWGDGLEKKHEISFSTGYCVGSGKPFVLYGENKKAIPLCNGKAIVLSNEEELKDFITGEEKNYKRQQYIEAAKTKISEMGLELSIRDLVDAVSKGENLAVTQFIKAGFSTNSCDKNGVFLLNIAARNGHLKTASILIENGADINSVSGDRGNTPLMDAAAGGYTEILMELIEAGVELDEKSKSGQTALVLAIGRQAEDTALALIESRAEIDIKDDLGMSAKKYAELFKLEHVLSSMVKTKDDSRI